MRRYPFRGFLVGGVKFCNQLWVLFHPIDMGGDAEIGNVAAAGEFPPALGNADIDRSHIALLRQQRGIGRLPDLHGRRAIGHGIADQAGGRGIDHRKFCGVGALLPGEPIEHHIIGGALCRGEVLALQIPQRLDLGPGGDDRSPIVEQIEKISHLDAAGIGKADRQQRGAAAKLKLAGVELRGIGVGRAFLEFDRKAVLLVEFLRLDYRRQERAERWRAEDDNRNRLRRFGKARRRPQQCRDASKADTNVTHGRPFRNSRQSYSAAPSTGVSNSLRSAVKKRPTRCLETLLKILWPTPATSPPISPAP